MNPYTDSTHLFQLLEALPPWYKEMLISIHADNMAVSTKCGYCRDVTEFFQYLIKNNPLYKDYKTTDFTLEDLARVTPLDAKEYAATLVGYAASTASRKLAAVSSMYIELMRYNRVPSNPFAVVRRPKIKQGVLVYLTVEEQDRLMRIIATGEGLTEKQLEYHQPVRDTALFSLFLDTGLRISEVVALNYIDIDLEVCSAIVTRKGGKHEVIYFSDYTAGCIKDYVEERGMYFDSQDPLFVGRLGTRLSSRSIERLLDNYAKIAFPTKHISPHKLRSSFAMHFYEETHDLLLLKDKMGHADIRTTNIYARSVAERMRDTRNIFHEN